MALADEAAGGATVWDGFSGFLSPDWDRDLSVTLGTKVWLNEWSRERELTIIDASTSNFDRVEVESSALDHQESDIEPVPIPQLSVRYKWLIVTGGYYSKTGFDFGRSVIEVRQVEPGELTLSEREFEASGERYEWDASFSYTHGVEHLMPHLPLSAATAYAGYRYQTISTDIDNTFASEDPGDVTEGFAVGVNFAF